MTKRMLIDGTHAEEVRVVIADESRIHEFDISSTTKTQNKGNIYLAKVTRVEPSLQAAFVEYGADRQGFLPFSEIHPDYYQIPVADRKKLLEEVAAAMEAEEDEDDDDASPTSSDAAAADATGEDKAGRDREGRDGGRRRRRRGGRGRRGDRPESSESGAAPSVDSAASESGGSAASDQPVTEADAGSAETAASTTGDDDKPSRSMAESMPKPPVAVSEPLDEPSEEEAPKAAAETTEAMATDVTHATVDSEVKADEASDAELKQAEEQERQEIEVLGDEVEEGRRERKTAFFKRYKIQEVIKRGQVMLVQVVKEERGNKGASLSTYISLAGRYCVLMPNSPKAGGISRKIASGEDRKRLKQISEEIRSANGMSAIIRTAGIDRTRAEIKRDYDYLVKLWEQIRELTISSTAPAMVHEEGDIIKRSLRDLYTSDIKEVVVAGEDPHKRAKEFMKMMMPSHAARIKLHNDTTPIFYSYDVEEQLLKMHEPQVKLQSGGSIVINPTEALVAIDVNSGRATTERNVEETALKTNIEAAQEIARQVRLRDLAGLIVIDFIDMFEYKNRRTVERQLKEALKADRAKIQVGRISAFGLLEMSRQRMRPSLSETNMVVCSHCEGRGHVLSPETLSIQLLRLLGKEASNEDYKSLKLRVMQPIALHMLNTKREHLAHIERTHHLRIYIEVAEHLVTPSSFILERVGMDGQKTEVSGLDGVPALSKRARQRKRKRGGDDRRPHHGSGADDRDAGDDILEDGDFVDEGVDAIENRDTDEVEEKTMDAPHANGEREDRQRRGRRRRGGRGHRDRDRDRSHHGSAASPQRQGEGASVDEFGDVNGNVALPPENEDDDHDTSFNAPQDNARGEDGDRQHRRRRRGGRGRRRWREGEGGSQESGQGAHSPQRGSSAEPSSPAAPIATAPANDHRPEGGDDGSKAEGGKRGGWWRRIVE